MGITLKVDNIVGTSGTSAPITLSGDNATLGSTVTFPDKIRDRDVWYPIHNGHSNSGDFLTSNDLDNGNIKILVPPFIENDDQILVDTRNLEYIKKIK